MESLSVSWKEYEKNICKGLGGLQQRGEFVDMTLAADGHHVKVHQMVMSLVSPFIKELITSANCPHPVIFLNRVSYETMEAILEYAYTGEVVVSKDMIGQFLEACKDLHIRGLEKTLEGVQCTVSNLYSGIETENGTIPSNRKKRKKPEETSFEEIVDIDDDDDDDDFHMAEVTVEEEPNKSLLSENEEQKLIGSIVSENKTENDKTSKNKGVVLQYSVSCHGNLQVVVNRYLYALKYIRKNDQHRFWRCINQQATSCPAVITTYHEKLVERSFRHNHPFHDAQIVKRVKKGNMFTSLNEVQVAAAAKLRKKEDIDLKKVTEIS